MLTAWTLQRLGRVMEKEGKAQVFHLHLLPALPFREREREAAVYQSLPPIGAEASCPPPGP